jgi:hypothetical protein
MRVADFDCVFADEGTKISPRIMEEYYRKWRIRPAYLFFLWLGISESGLFIWLEKLVQAKMNCLRATVHLKSQVRYPVVLFPC